MSDYGRSPMLLREGSRELVAHKLMHEVLHAEGLAVYQGAGKKIASRKLILDTYAECLVAVEGRRQASS